jgi:phosphoribosylformylglycinamidine synthase
MTESGEIRTTQRSWLAEIVVMPKPGVSDPAGNAVHGGLRNLGYDEVRDVRVGRFVRVEIWAGTEDAAYGRAVQMCEDLLANPVIEEYEVHIHDGDRRTWSNDKRSGAK